MKSYIKFENKVGKDVFDSSGYRITVSDISGVPFMIYMGESALYPTMIIDSGNDYVDALDNKQVQIVLEAAYDIIGENPQVYFGENMTDEDRAMWENGEMYEIQIDYDIMFPPNNIRADEAGGDLEDVKKMYADWSMNKSIPETRFLGYIERAWKEVPLGAKPTNANEIVSACTRMIEYITGNNISKIEKGFTDLIVELNKAESEK